jgi:two-component system, NarL family, response regulator DevR
VKQVLYGCLDDRVLVAGATTVAELLEMPMDFDAVILDVLLADGSSPATNVARLRSSHAEVLLFTALEPGDPSRDDDVNAAMEAGARALIFKGDADRELLDALKEVLAGSHYFNLAWSRALGRVRSDMSLLTSREKEVYLKHRAGLSQQEIADLFCLSRETVKSHFKSINAKLNGRP